MGGEVVPRNLVLPLRPVVRSSRPQSMAVDDVQDRRQLVRAFVTVAAAAAVVGVFNVAVRLRVAELGYQLEATHRAIERLELEKRQLQAEAARAEDVQRLQRLAALRLGLIPAGPSQRVVVP